MCLYSNVFRKCSGYEAQETQLEPPPWKETLNDGGDTSEANVAMGNVHQSRDTVKGLQLLDDPCWDSDTTRRTTAGEPYQGGGPF